MERQLVKRALCYTLTASVCAARKKIGLFQLIFGRARITDDAAFFAATVSGCVEIMQRLETPECLFAHVDAAAEHGHLNVLLYFERILNGLGWFTETILCGAAKKGHIHVVEYILGSCAVSDSELRAAVMVAVDHGQLELIDYLFCRGVNVFFWNDLPLRQAARRGYLSVVQYLHERGADIYAENFQSVRWARLGGHDDVVKYLVGCKK